MLLSGLGHLWALNTSHADATHDRAVHDRAAAAPGAPGTSTGASRERWRLFSRQSPPSKPPQRLTSPTAPPPPPLNTTALLRQAALVIGGVWRSHLIHAESGGVLREENEPATLTNGSVDNLYSGGPGTDSLQFKSILLRHLGYLMERVVSASGSEAAAHEAVAAAGGNLSEWRGFVALNARSIWELAACAPPTPLTPGTMVTVPALFGFLWMGPCSWAFGGPTATSQSAALDVFVAAAAMGPGR